MRSRRFVCRHEPPPTGSGSGEPDCLRRPRSGELVRRTRALVTPASGPGRGRSGRTRYLEVSDLGSVSKLVRVASSCFAHFYEGLGASACNTLT